MKIKFDGNITEFFTLFGGIAVPVVGTDGLKEILEAADEVEGNVHLWIDDDEFEFTMRGEMK